MFPWTEWIALAILLVSASYIAVHHGTAKSTIPLINPRKPWESGTSSARQQSFADMPGLIKEGLSKVSISIEFDPRNQKYNLKISL